MKKWLKRLGVVALLLLAAAAAFVVPTVFGKPWKIDHFYMRVLVGELLDAPLLLTQLRMFEAVGLTFHADDLPDQTLQARSRPIERMKANLETLESYGRDSLAEDQRLSYDVMHWLITTGFEVKPRFMKHPYTIDQMQGLHVRFPDVMVNYHLIEDSGDAEDYLTRVNKIAKALADLAQHAADLEKEGFTIPKFILTKIAQDTSDFADKPVTENALYVDFAKKVSELDDREKLEKRMRTSLETSALPGYRKFLAAIRAMEARVSNDAGVWHLPDGDAYYAERVRIYTTTEMKPDALHQLGLQEVERIQKEMRETMAKLSVPTSTASFGDTLRQLASNDEYYFEDSDEGRKAIIARYEEIIRDIEGKLEPMFATNPKKPLDVKPVAEFKQKTAPFAYYFPAAIDGTTPAAFFANLRDVREHPKFGMRTLAYHEAIPGHHFQLSIARTQEHLPFFRQLIPISAYSEGWALYAEQLAAEHGFMDEPLDRLGHLDAQLFRAVRLVVDTGLHAQRWPRDKAVEYAYANTGMKKGEVETEIDRYCVWPGQALSYMVGRLEILRLRDHAHKELGKNFDERKFHDALLREGSLPLKLLAKEVDALIKESNSNSQP